MPIKQRHLRTLSRRFWGFFFGAIIALAVLVQIGRQAFPLVNDYKPLIASSLGKQLGVVINIGEIRADWQGLRPKVMLNEVYVLSERDDEVFYIENALAELSLIDSLIQRGLAWRTITFKNFRTTFVQKDNFSWGIKGYDGGTANNENPFLFDDPLDIFLFGRRVQIEAASLNFEFNNGKTSELSIPSIALENDRFFHRMTAALNIEGKESLRFVVEGYGDPRNKEKFSASGYLELNDIPTTEIYNAIFDSEDDAFDDGIEATIDQVTNLEFWFKGSPQTGMTAVGAMSISGLPEALEEHFDLPDSMSANLTGTWKVGTGWFAHLQDINVDWGDNKLPLDALSLYGKERDIGLRIAKLDVTSLIEVALAANLTQNSRVSESIKELKPQGVLENIDVKLTSKEQGYFLARMNVVGGGSQAFKGSPALENIDGYVEASLNAGYIDANIEHGFSLDLAKVFDQPIVIDDVVGQLAWRIDIKNKVAYLKSSRLSATQDQSDILGAFALTMPFKRELGEQHMTLQLEVDQSDVVKYRSYLPKNVPESLKKWLYSAIEGGEARDIAVFYNGSVSKAPERKPIYQISATVSDITVAYDKSWPALKGVKGEILVDSDAVWARIDSASTNGANIRSATLNLGRRINGRTPPMRIAAKVDGKSSDAKAFLIDSPLSAKLSDFLRQWQLTGSFDSDLKLSIPVEFDPNKIDYEVVTRFHSNSALMETVGLAFDNINGTFNYSKAELAESSDLTMSLWDRDVDAQITSDLKSGDITVNFSAPVNAQSLRTWLARPELFALEQDFNAKGNIVIPTTERSDTKAPRIHLSSSLEGVALDLPQSLGKTQDETGEYALDIEFGDLGVNYKYFHNAAAAVDINISSSSLPAVAIKIGYLDQELIQFPGRILVAGELESADFDAWLTAYGRYIDEIEALSQDVLDQDEAFELEQVEETIMTTANLVINSFSFGELMVPDLVLNINNDEHNWMFELASERLNGSVTIPLDGEPIALDFQSLSLFPADYEQAEAATVSPLESDLELEPTSVFAEVDLSKLIALDVNIDDLKILGEEWGRWQFDLEPIDGGIQLKGLNAEFKELKIGQEEYSEFLWTRSPSGTESRFVGQIEIKNAAKVLEAWEQEPIVTSKRGVFDIDAFWNAEPDLVSLANLNGDVDLKLVNGSFVRATAAGENPLLRLIALFNFDTLARRIRLDFSDLAARGFAYDTVSSSVNFKEGIATLSEPLIVESSSSRMQMAGIVDLIEEEVDAELVVTLPVASNIAVATAFLVGVPAGLGVYIVSKMLGKTVDKASSINYSLSGSWDDPKIKVRKIFDDEAALRKGESLKDKPAADDENSSKPLEPEVAVPAEQ